MCAGVRCAEARFVFSPRFRGGPCMIRRSLTPGLSQMKKSRRCAALLVSLLSTTFSVPAFSQQAQGFALNRFDPSERGSEWFALESLDLRGDGRLAFGVVGDWSHKPLVLYGPDGSEKNLIVSDQLFVHVGGGIILADRFRLSVNLPIAAYQA